jgi:hypothetical protein
VRWKDGLLRRLLLWRGALRCTLPSCRGRAFPGRGCPLRWCCRFRLGGGKRLRCGGKRQNANRQSYGRLHCLPPPSIPVPGRLTKHFDSVHFSHIAWRVRDGAAHECDVPHSCKADVADILTAAMQEAIILLAEKPRADRCGLGGLPGHNHKSSWPCLSRPSTFFLVSVRRLLDSFESLGFDGAFLIRGGGSSVDGQEPGEI